MNKKRQLSLMFKLIIIEYALWHILLTNDAFASPLAALPAQVRWV
jgi:hypothetical protein